MDLGARPVRTFLKVTMPQISISMTILGCFRLYDLVRPSRDNAVPCAGRQQHPADRDVPVPPEVAGPDDRGAFDCSDRGVFFFFFGGPSRSSPFSLSSCEIRSLPLAALRQEKEPAE